MLRRSLLLTTALIPLAGCSTSTSSVSSLISQAGSIIAAISNGVSSVVNNVPGLPADVLTLFTKAQAVASAATAQLGTINTTAGALPFVQQVLNAVGPILSVAGIALPPPFNLVLPALTAALPALASLFNLTAPSTSRRFAAVTMSPAQAVAYLNSLPR